MKIFIKIAVFLLGIGGVLYWFGTLCARPATRLWAHHKAKKAGQAEYSGETL